MATCQNARPAPLRCPTLVELVASALQLLPHGRAWQSNEGGPAVPANRAFNAGAFNNDSFATKDRPGSTLYRFWRAVATAFDYCNQRLCALRYEFFCATHKETHDLWMAEYGLPDLCDPFPDLCTKVAAIGGTRCEYYAEIAARSGWEIECSDVVGKCGSRVGFSRAGKAKCGRTMGLAEMRIIVHLPSSSALQSRGRYLPSISGRMRAGRRQSCGPSLAPLVCILSRIIHAEINTIYEVSNVA